MNNPTPNQPSILAACCAVLVVGALLLAGTGCSEYNKIMKSTDLDYKYERALGFWTQTNATEPCPFWKRWSA